MVFLLVILVTIVIVTVVIIISVINVVTIINNNITHVHTILIVLGMSQIRYLLPYHTCSEIIFILLFTVKLDCCDFEMCRVVQLVVVIVTWGYNRLTDLI